jgi:uncharacterized membrane protein
MVENDSLPVIQRMSALSDGIFAVSMTLLAYNVHLPAVTPDVQMSRELLRMFWEVGALLLSFAIAALFWRSHLRLFQLLRRVDSGFQLVNFALLFSIVLLPISTGLSTSFRRSPETLFVLGGNLVLVSLTNLAVWIYAYLNRLLAEPRWSPRLFLIQLIPSIFSTLVFCGSLFAVGRNPRLVHDIWSVAFVSPFLGRLARRWLA